MSGDIETNLLATTIPIVAVIAKHAKVHYAEIVAAISSEAARPDTRANIDEIVESTARAIETLAGAAKGRAILVLNPAAPPPLMRETVFVLSDPADREAVRASVDAMVTRVQEHLPGCRLKQPVQFDEVAPSSPLRIPGLGTFSGLKTSVFLELTR